MSTSGTYVWATNVSTVINNSLRKINRLGDFETVAAGEGRYDHAFGALNPILKRNAAFGMPIWNVSEAYINFSTTGLNTTSGTLIGISQTINQAAPLKLLQAVRRDNIDPTNPIDVPLEIYTYDYYESLSQKGAEGTPVGIWYQPLPASSTSTPNYGRIKLWLLPDTYWTTTSSGQLYIRYQRPFQDVTTGTEEFDFPDHWIQAITYQLAYALAPDYGLDPTQRVALKADMKEEVDLAKSFDDEEGSYRIQPRLDY